MIGILVVIDGDLGDFVVDALEATTVKFRVHRLARKDALRTAGPANLIVVDDVTSEKQRADMIRFHGAPIFVVGADIPMPFDVTTFQRAIAEAATVRASPGGEDLVAIDPPLRRALELIRGVAKHRSAVLISGPTGTGKELLARRVHTTSDRQGPLVVINCATIPSNLAETTLFGHVRGAFTGAVSDAKGAFAEADKGTLFLDEIGELEPIIQAKLLRALDEGAIRAVGAQKSTTVDIRLVAATNRDLEQEAGSGRFRPDLYYRLATFCIEIPGLCQRPRDLRALIDHYWKGHERAGCLSISSEALDMLMDYPWPGNVRELRNVLERVLALAPPGEVGPRFLFELAPELARGSGPNLLGVRMLKARRCDYAREEERAIRAFMEAGIRDRRQLATALGVHRSTLWRKMKRLNIS